MVFPIQGTRCYRRSARAMNYWLKPRVTSCAPATTSQPGRFPTEARGHGLSVWHQSGEQPARGDV